jgi:hypothetical protein
MRGWKSKKKPSLSAAYVRALLALIKISIRIFVQFFVLSTKPSINRSLGNFELLCKCLSQAFRPFTLFLFEPKFKYSDLKFRLVISLTRGFLDLQIEQLILLNIIFMINLIGGSSSEVCWSCRRWSRTQGWLIAITAWIWGINFDGDLLLSRK